MSTRADGSSLVEHMLVIGPDVAHTWRYVRNALAVSCLGDEKTDEYMDHLYWEIFHCHSQLWVFHVETQLKAAIITRIFRAFDGKVVCEMYMVAGRERELWEGPAIAVVGDWARRENAADILAITGRPGWTRTVKQYGFTEYSRTLYKTLGE